jgi:hypothetical protein
MCYGVNVNRMDAAVSNIGSHFQLQSVVIFLYRNKQHDAATTTAVLPRNPKFGADGM